MDVCSLITSEQIDNSLEKGYFKFWKYTVPMGRQSRGRPLFLHICTNFQHYQVNKANKQHTAA